MINKLQKNIYQFTMLGLIEEYLQREKDRNKGKRKKT